jgi:hypothetical protein
MNPAAHTSSKTSRRPLKGTAMKAPSVSVTALCVGLFYVGLFADGGAAFIARYVPVIYDERPSE